MLDLVPDSFDVMSRIEMFYRLAEAKILKGEILSRSTTGGMMQATVLVG